MTAEHRHEIPLRWADLDSLNHVNNVQYLRYAAEARAELLDGGVIEDRRTTRVAVEFVRPIQLGPRPVVVTSRVEDDRLVQQIGIDGASHVLACVTTDHDPVPTAGPVEGVDTIAIFLRRLDLDERGVVSPVQVGELLQESRIPYMTSLMAGQRGSVVLAHLDMRLHAAIPWRREPVESRVWIDRLGGSSYTIAAQLCVDGRVAVSSEAVLVGFDTTTQRSRPLTEAERAALSHGLRS
ncbi:acyl-[acyl-carrier-protein] thioesterase [uncultured Aeromicrobium sp.]|uniref:acyl-[acyl-carrier-protein] thioesterase n=1 Tax=uncultured Aeromicrobium sp. TaxID=337820 RepID=UPI0025D3D321|nr:acyl-[acyl-carrier-protein] thioesterase [uncultured Aeromicrobium sp.]